MVLLGDVTIDRIEQVATRIGDRDVLSLCSRAKLGDESAIRALRGLLLEAQESIGQSLRDLGEAIKAWALDNRVDFKVELCDQSTPDRALITLEEAGEWVSVWWEIPEGYATLEKTLDQMLRKLRNGATPVSEAC